MPGRRKTRPWAGLRGETPQQNAAAALLRSWMDEAGLTLTALHEVLSRGYLPGGRVPSRSTLGRRLAGLNLDARLVEAVAAACFPDGPTRAVRAEQAKQALTGLASAAGQRSVPGRRQVLSSGGIGHLGPALDEERLARSPEQLRWENDQLRLNVAELGRRVSKLTKDLAVVSDERDRLRRRCQEALRRLTAQDSALRRVTARPVVTSDPAQSKRGDDDSDGMESRVSGEREHSVPPMTGPLTLPRKEEPAPGKAAGAVPDAVPAEGTPRPADGGVRTAPAQDATDVLIDSVLPLDFQAFFTMNAEAYQRYASVRIQSPQQAKEAVQETFTILLSHWKDFLTSAEPAGLAWKVLRDAVERRAPGLRPEPDLFRELGETRTVFSLMETPLGLYQAIASLPERTFDAVVLHYVLGRTHQDVARLIGESPVGVRVLLRQARRRLAHDLDLGLGNAL